MKKYIIILALLPITILAQNSPFTREVQVERDYIPSVREANRLTTSPQIQQPSQERSDAPYSVWTTIAEVDAPKQNLPATELPTPQYTRGDRFIRLGAGNYTSFLGDLFLPIISNERTSWIFEAKHRSTFGKITLDNDRKVQAKNMDNRLRTAVEHRFDNLVLAADARFNRRDYNYYGTNSFMSESEPNVTDNNVHFADFGIGAGLRSLYLPENSFDFNASLNYNYFTHKLDFFDLTTLTEHHVTVQGGAVKKFDNSNFGANFALDMLSYTNVPEITYIDGQFAFFLFENYAAFKINPYYTLFANDMEIRLGLNAYFSGKGEYPAALSPDVRITYNTLENRLLLLAYAQGNYQINSFARIMRENPYVSPSIQVEDTYTPFDLGAGIKGKITENIMAKGSLGYKRMMNEYFYDPNMGSLFNVIYQKTWQFYSNISLEGNWSDRFNTLLTWDYNHWDVDAWHKPEHEIRLSSNYRVTDKINLSASGYVATGRFKDAYIYLDPNINYRHISDIYDMPELNFKLDPIIDFNLGGTYKFNNSFTAFLQANNIFASRYHIWYGYNAHRFNAMAGLTYSF